MTPRYDSVCCYVVRPDAEGMRTVLELRGKYATPRKELGDPAKYLDLTYYDKAFARP